MTSEEANAALKIAWASIEAVGNGFTQLSSDVICGGPVAADLDSAINNLNIALTQLEKIKASGYTGPTST